MASLINSGSIIDHVDKPAIHPDDAVYQSLTPTSNGKVAVTVNGSSVTDYVHARGLIKAAGHATNYLSLKNGLKSGQEVHIRETGESKYAELIERGSAKTGSRGGKSKAREALLDAALKTFKRGGLVKKGHKDYRKGGIFY